MNVKLRLLVIEDHREIGDMLVEYFESVGYELEWATDGVMALHLLGLTAFDLIILDVNLPKMDGVKLCGAIRQQLKLDTPIVMLTARDTVDDRIAGLDAGADDYLCKPFDLRELHSRIKAQCRRASGSIAKTRYAIGPLLLDTEQQQATRDGKLLALTPTTYQILHTLVDAYPKVVSRKRLEQILWGDQVTESDALRSHLYTLRQVLDKPFTYPMIETLPGRGIKLRGESLPLAGSKQDDHPELALASTNTDRLP